MLDLNASTGDAVQKLELLLDEQRWAPIVQSPDRVGRENKDKNDRDVAADCRRTRSRLGPFYRRGALHLL